MSESNSTHKPNDSNTSQQSFANEENAQDDKNQSVRVSFSGPLPPPHVLKQYEEMQP